MLDSYAGTARMWTRTPYVQILPQSDSLQSLVADYYSNEDRGKAFGTLYTTGIASARMRSWKRSSRIFSFSRHCLTWNIVHDLCVKLLTARVAACAGALGGMLGAVFATNMAGHQMSGIEGWRFAFRMVGVAAIMIGLVSLVCIKDPRVVPTVRSGEMLDHGLPQKHTAQEILSEFWTVWLPDMCRYSFGVV